ncbi:MAG TPA: MBL fold metallo-hydrolase [Terriglobia bacterium]|nr:MBL fold metallo-hydrolase [Terriglobia bacterium]
MRMKSAFTFIALFALAAWPGLRPVFAASPGARAQAAANPANLQIYVIDVEGGQSTLIVTPAHQSLLVDAGWAGFNGRDADRIVQAAKLAGINRINFLLITHYHADHVGGVPQLAERIPIDNFLDHGPDVEKSADGPKLYSAYLKATQKGRHRVVKPGDTIPLRGVKVVVVAAAGRHLEQPLDGAGQANPYCNETRPMEMDPSENAQSSGIVLTYGKFRFVDLGDLTWNKEIALMCPVNRLGRIGVFLASHHGESISNSKALVWAIEPRVTLIDNGATKGGTPEAWQRIYEAPGRERIWQLHYSEAAGKDANAGPDYIANAHKQPDQGHYLEVSARPDGGFTVINSRNDFKVDYPSPRLSSRSITP